MSAPLASTGGESRNTLLLYCPYDRKVTGHARRGPEGTVVCVECGRKLEISHTERTAPIIPLAPPPAPYNGPRSMRARRAAIWRRRSQTPWVPLVLVGLVTIVAAFALIGSLGNPFASSASSRPTAAAGAVPPRASTQAEPVQPAVSAEAPPSSTNDLRVANTGGTGVFLRRTPNMNDRVRAWADGTPLKVIGADTNVEGVDWKNVQDPAGNQGWIPVQYTTPAS